MQRELDFHLKKTQAFGDVLDDEVVKMCTGLRQELDFHLNVLRRSETFWKMRSGKGARAVINFKPFMSIHSCQFIRFNSFMSSHYSKSLFSIYSCQFIHANLFMPIHPLQFIHLKSFMPSQSCQVSDFKSFMSIHSCQFIHAMSCMRSFIHSFHSCIHVLHPLIH